MKKLIFTVLLAAASCGTLMAQSRNVYSSSRGSGSVEIIGDVAVNQLVEKHIEINDRVKTIPGYRVQIASLSGTNAKANAFALKSRFKEAYAGIEVYIEFSEPNFRVKVGDFKTRLEAFAYLQQIKDIYPGTIVRDDIYPIQLDWSEMIPESEDDI